MTDSRPVLEQYNEFFEILGRFTQHNMNMDESLKVLCIIDKLPPSWKDFKHTLKHLKEELTLIEFGSHLCIEESLRAQDNDKPKSNNVAGPSVVYMVDHNNSSRYNDNKEKRKHHDTRANPNKKPKVTCWKCRKPGHLKKGFKAGNDDDVAWWVDSGATVHVCKDRCWFKTYESQNDGYILHMGNKSTALVHGRGCVDLRFSSGKVVSLLNVLHVPNIRKNLVSSSVLNNYGYKQVIESNKFVLSKHGVFISFGYLSNHMFRLNIVFDNIGSAFMSTSKLNDSILWHARLGHVHFKRMQDMSKDGLIPAFDMDTKKCQTCMLNKITKKLFQNVKRETKVLELIHSDLCDLHATPLLGNKKYFVTFIDDASRFFYVYLLHLKDEALDKFKSIGIIHETTAPYTSQQNGISERKNRVLKEMVNSMLSYSGLSQGFWGEAMLTACYLLNRVPKRNKVTPYELWTKKKPNMNYLRVWGCRAVVRLLDQKLKTLGERGIECIFVGYAEHSKAFRFYVIEPNDSVAINSIIESRDAIFDEHRFSSVPRPSQRSLQSEPRKSKRHRTLKDFGPEFQLYLVEGTRDEVSDQHSYCFNVEDDPKTFDEAMKSQDAAFWKEAINDEMDSIMGNNTWVLADLPPGCRPLGCKWIFKRKMKVDGTVEKFKARLVIQGFNQRSGIDYFDTYAPVARISTIRLLIALASIHSLIIHQMDVKTAFLNGELEEEVYMNQPLGFIMPGNENKMCKLIKSLYGLKQAPKQWHQKFDEVVLSNGYLLNQADKYVYSKFDASGKGVIICLYVDDMLIFGIDQAQVDLTKEFLSSRFSMKDMREADVILGIRIKHESNVSTPLDTCEKLMPNRGLAVFQLEYSRVIGCLMYAMTCTRPDIAFAMGKLSRYTSNPGTQHWQAIQRISNTEDNSSTSGWVFLLGGGAISWASKKQTCITGSTMEYEFVALAAAGKEAEWLKNLLLEIPLWVKPMAPISIRYDSAATLAKAYSQMYNGKSRHLGVRHNMIRKLITNGVISIEFVRSQQNLADHLTKGLARDLVIKSAKGMGLKSNQVAEC
ncbi:zinc finger, CCHC-type containing protein [Tanacetum coccineum]